MKNNLIEFCQLPEAQARAAAWFEMARRTQVLMGTQVPAQDLAAPGEKPALICDPASYAAYGKKIEQSLGAEARLVMLPTPPADMQAVNALRAETAMCDVLIGVGSGTISDLCKYASHLEGKPYAICATAPSMNGYASANASISEHGHKKSLPAHLPRMILLDLEVLARAPVRLIRSGLGDSLCRSTAQADWLLSHLLLGTKYDDTPFRLLFPYEGELLAKAEGLQTGELEALALLTRTLIVSGFGMMMAGGSYPASQGEHLIAHTMEMKHGHRFGETYHGEQIGVTTLTMARLQDAALGARPQFSATAIDERAILDYFGEETGEEVIAAFRKKALGLEQAALNERMKKEWGEIAEQLRAVRLPTPLLHQTLHKAGCATLPKDLGWPQDAYEDAVRFARTVRERFTFLDIA